MTSLDFLEIATYTYGQNQVNGKLPMKMQAIQETSPMESQTLVAVVQHQNGTSPRKTPFQNGSLRILWLPNIFR